jgi:hypothetical protein
MNRSRKKARADDSAVDAPMDERDMEALDELLECASSRSLSVVLWTLPESRANDGDNTIPFLLPVYIQFVNPLTRTDIEVPDVAFSDNLLRKNLLVNCSSYTALKFQVFRRTIVRLCSRMQFALR